MQAEVRLYDHLFTAEHPEATTDGNDYKDVLNPHSLERRSGCWVESHLTTASVGSRYQFERLGYFCVDPDSSPNLPVFNKTIGLRDTWAKMQKQKK